MSASKAATGTKQPRFFATAAAWRAWLTANGEGTAELLVGFYKVGSGRPSMTWPESVDEALCFGWIDGVRKRRDEHSYTIRFSPRRPTSIWSAVNLANYERLHAAGRVTPAGARAFECRREAKTAIYAYEQRHTAQLTAAEERRFKRNKKAWTFFGTTPPGYRKIALYYVVSAKKAETRASRLARLIETSAAGQRL